MADKIQDSVAKNKKKKELVDPTDEQVKQIVDAEETEEEKSLRERLAELKDARESELRGAEWGQVAEKLGQAIAQYGAARSGLKSGVDLSKIKPEGLDWERKMDRIMKKYDQGERAEKLKEDIKKEADEDKFGRWRSLPQFVVRDEKGRLIPVQRHDKTGEFKTLFGESVTKEDLRMKPNWKLNKADGKYYDINDPHLDKQTGKVEKPYETYMEFRQANPTVADKVDKIADNYQKDHTTQREVEEKLITLNKLVRENTPGSRRAVQNLLARGFGEVGVMTDKDVEGFAGVDDLFGKIEDFVERRWAGEEAMSEEVQQNYFDLIHSAMDAAKNARRRMNNQYIDRAGFTAGKRATPEYISRHLNIRTFDPAEAKAEGMKRSKEIVERREKRRKEEKEEPKSATGTLKEMGRAAGKALTSPGLKEGEIRRWDKKRKKHAIFNKDREFVRWED